MSVHFSIKVAATNQWQKFIIQNFINSKKVYELIVYISPRELLSSSLKFQPLILITNKV